MLIFLLIGQDSDTLTAAAVDKAPAIDGDASDEAWSKAKPLVIKIHKALEPDPTGIQVTLKAVVHNDTLYLLVQWPDETKDDVHKPWVWNKEKSAYEAGSQEEDVCSVAFPIEGEFNPNMLAYIKAKWDVWHWKAARTNPAGFAMDKYHVYSTEEFKGAKAFPSPKGNLWMSRPEDEGQSATAKAKAPAEFKGDSVAQFTAQAPEGSAADVKAKGAWKENVWTLEFARKLDTSHADDRALVKGEKIPFAVACFDRCEHDEHSVSEALQLVIPK
jgi:hypothetical protein